MRKLLLTSLNAIISIALLAWLIPSVSYQDIPTLVMAGVVLALLQLIVKPILKLLFLPINIITLGLFGWVLHILILWLLTFLVPGFELRPTVFLGVQLGEFGTLILVSFMLSLIQSVVGIVVR